MGNDEKRIEDWWGPRGGGLYVFLRGALDVAPRYTHLLGPRRKRISNVSSG